MFFILAFRQQSWGCFQQLGALLVVDGPHSYTHDLYNTSIPGLAEIAGPGGAQKNESFSMMSWLGFYFVFYPVSEGAAPRSATGPANMCQMLISFTNNVTSSVSLSISWWSAILFPDTLLHQSDTLEFTRMSTFGCRSLCSSRSSRRPPMSRP